MSVLTTWWTAQQQGAHFGASSLAVSATLWTGEADPDSDPGVATMVKLVDRGEQPGGSGGMDTSKAVAQAMLNKADVTLVRSGQGRYGFLSVAGVRWAIVRITGQNDAMYLAECEQQSTDRTGNTERQGS